MEENFEGVNESVPAEQTEASEPEVNTEGTEGEVETTETTETPEVTEEPELDRNAIYADARRKAEAEYKRKQSAIDAQFAEKFKDYKNPITGQPIQTAQDYYNALIAQEQIQTKKTLADKGIDPEIIDRAVNNNPAIKAANAVIAEQRIRDVKTYLDKQIEEVGKIDPDIKSAQDIEKSERYPEILNYVNNNRLSIVDAYKLVYADKLNDRKTSAVKQQAINNAKSQQHLKSTDGGNKASNDLREIPQSQLDEWRNFFNGKSDAEIRELYNSSLH